MSVVINGVRIRWALPDFAISETAVGQMIFQSFEQTKMDEPETIKSNQGVTVTRIWPDPSDEITFSGFITSTTSLADAKVQAKLVALGTIVTVTFDSSGYAGFTSGAKAEIQAGKLSGTNTSAMKVDLTLRIWPAISTAAA